MEPIRPYEIFYKVFQPVNRQIFEYITQRMLLALKCYKRNCWTIHETHEHTGKISVQKISITVESQGAVNTPVIRFQTVYSSERETIKCEMETKNVSGVPDGKYEVFYIANTDEFIYASDPKVSDYMNIIFAPSFVDVLYKDITIIVTTLRMHQDTYEHEKEVQKRKMEHGETEDDKCDAAWQQTLLHLSETLRQMNTEHTGVRYETILFGRGKHTPPVLFAYVVRLPYDVMHGIIVIAANLDNDTALELRYYQTSSGLLPNADKTTVMSITHAGVACSGYDEAYQKLCADVGKNHGDKIVGMIQETTGDPIKQKEKIMANKNKWVVRLENIHNKIQKFNYEGERFIIKSNFSQWGDESAQITVFLCDKADDAGEPFGEIRYTVNEKHDFLGAKWDAGLTIRYFSNRQDVQWCEPLSIVDANTGKYIAREESKAMLKDLGSRWTDKFIGLLKAEADKPIEEETNKKEECAMSERTHTIELRSVIIGKGVLPKGCDEHYHIALKIFSADADVHKRIFKMYEDCPLENPIDAKERHVPSRDGDTTTVVIFVPNVDEIDMRKVYDYYSTITLSLESRLVPGNTLLNAVVKHIKVPSIGEWDGLPKKQHTESIEKRTKRMVVNSAYGMMSRSFDECVEDVASYVQAIDPESDVAKKLDESINAISANPGETIYIDSLGCNNKTNSGGTTMRGTSISIEKLFFNGTTTIIMWTDGTKTVVQPIEGEKFDPEIGIAMAIARKIFGSRHQFDKFTANVFRESYARDAKSLTEKELLMLLTEYEKIIASAKAKHDAVHQAYEKAVSEGSKKLPKLYGLKSDPDYRYAAIRASVIKAELESRKAKKAARAASTKKDTKKPTTAKKSSTRKKSTK